MSLNDAYFNAQLERVKASRDCQDLERIATQTVASVQGVIDGYTDQISQLAGLITSPTNLSTLLTWAGSASAMFAAISATATADLAAVTSAIATLTAAINEQKSKLNCGF